MKKILFGIFLVLTFVIAATPAEANCCSFTGSCNAITRACTFNISASCNSGSAIITGITCENPTATDNTAPYQHTFATSAGGNCTASCFCSSTGEILTSTRYVCFAFGVPGCIQPGIGFN